MDLVEFDALLKRARDAHRDSLISMKDILANMRSSHLEVNDLAGYAAKLARSSEEASRHYKLIIER
jgi:hypothetical protein